MKKICIAVDISNDDFNLFKFSQSLRNDVVLKLGLEFFTKFGLNCLDGVKNEIFVDLKLHDIPNTVSHAVRNICRFSNVGFLTIHASGGKEMICGAVNARNLTKSNAKILCVTKLTSQNATVEEVLPLVEFSLKNGADGVVCSAMECIAIRKEFGEELVIVTPGIRPVWYVADDDQVRVATPRQAFDRGSNVVVIGRPVMQHNNPSNALEMIFKECF